MHICMCDAHLCISQLLYGFEVFLVRTLEFSSSSDGGSFNILFLLSFIRFTSLFSFW